MLNRAFRKIQSSVMFNYLKTVSLKECEKNLYFKSILKAWPLLEVSVEFENVKTIGFLNYGLVEVIKLSSLFPLDYFLCMKAFDSNMPIFCHILDSDYSDDKSATQIVWKVGSRMYLILCTWVSWSPENTSLKSGSEKQLQLRH